MVDSGIYLSMADSPTSRAVEKFIHNLAAKFLSVTHRVVTSTLELRLVIALVVKPEFCLVLSTSVLSALKCIPDLVELFLPLRIDVPSFNAQDEVVKYDTAADPHDCPYMFLVSVDLNAELEQ